MPSRSNHSVRYFTVEGSGEFPFDMLRYDSAWPHSSADAMLMAGDAGSKRRTVVLATQSPYAPTVKRWASFTWRSSQAMARPDPDLFHGRYDVV